MKYKSLLLGIFIVLLFTDTIFGVYPEVLKVMYPYKGKSKKGTDTSTLKGKIMCGYQGWFSAKGDNSRSGWKHYEDELKGGGFYPGRCSIDFWPDMNEMDEDEKYPTPFKHKDGKTAYVFSSFNKKTVLRHFKWMEDYGVDGVFVQRFSVEFRDPTSYSRSTIILRHCIEGANKYGRAISVMYDISGTRRRMMPLVKEDWMALVDKMKIRQSRAYVKHNGKPVVALWGLGFTRRDYRIKEYLELIDFLKNDKKYGGNSVMLGIPTTWREIGRDCGDDAKEDLHKAIKMADIISPWSIGRYDTLEEYKGHVKKFLVKDIKWCRKNKIEYIPVVYPGYSRHNLTPGFPLDRIPRLKGKFLWQQYYDSIKSGSTMIYQAMFDEMDEGTCIFKVTENPPVGKSKFLNYEGLDSDHYLWLVGQGVKMLNKKIKLSDKVPSRKKLFSQ